MQPKAAIISSQMDRIRIAPKMNKKITEITMVAQILNKFCLQTK